MYPFSFNKFIHSFSAADVLTCTELMYEKMKKDLHSSDLHIALGLLCHALLISTAKNVNNFISSVFEKWTGICYNNHLSQYKAVSNIHSSFVSGLRRLFRFIWLLR